MHIISCFKSKKLCWTHWLYKNFYATALYVYHLVQQIIWEMMGKNKIINLKNKQVKTIK